MKFHHGLLWEEAYYNASLFSRILQIRQVLAVREKQ